MTTYSVTGWVVMVVEADSPGEAIKKANDNSGFPDFTVEFTDAEVEE